MLDRDIELEKWIDQNSLRELIRAVEDICLGKADHIRSNWQDESLAKSWERDGALFAKLITKVEN